MVLRSHASDNVIVHLILSLYKVLYLIIDEDTDIEALLAPVNFRCLVVSLSRCVSVLQISCHVISIKQNVDVVTANYIYLLLNSYKHAATL